MRWNVSFMYNFQISVFEELGDEFGLFSYEGEETALSLQFYCMWFSHRMFFMCFSPIQRTDRDNVRYFG